ncbi:hypothetical protein X975_12485, partial [Stegodyphus mimosarum]
CSCSCTAPRGTLFRKSPFHISHFDQSIFVIKQKTKEKKLATTRRLKKRNGKIFHGKEPRPAA